VTAAILGVQGHRNVIGIYGVLGFGVE
jgi:hypothetical protein